MGWDTIVVPPQLPQSITQPSAITNFSISVSLPNVSILPIPPMSIFYCIYTTAHYLSVASLSPPPSQKFQPMSYSNPPPPFLYHSSLPLPYVTYPTRSHDHCHHPLDRVSESVCITPPLPSSLKKPCVLCRPTIIPLICTTQHHHISAIKPYLPTFTLPNFPASPPGIHQPLLYKFYQNICCPPSSF